MVTRIVPNRFAGDPREGRDFFTEVLGLEIAMELDFISTYRAPGEPAAQLNVLSGDPSGLKPNYSIGVADVDACLRRAEAAGCEIVYPIRDEPWGVRRFFVRNPLGDIVNIVGHPE